MFPLDFLLNTIRRIYANDRLFSYDSMIRTCAEVEQIMKDIGLTEIQTIQFPADGIIAHGGWVMPPAWNARSAKLEVILSDGSRKTLCAYPEVPCSLMLYSTGCEFTGKMVMYAPDAEVKDKFVLGGNHFFSIQESRALYQKGAKIILSDKLLGPFAEMKEYERLNDTCQWCNYGLPFWREDGPRAGFSLSPNQSAYLQKLLHENGEVTLHAVVDADLSDGTIPLVTGFLPGETDEEIVLAGHLFEQGADDNASGCAMALAIARELVQKRRKRGIRLYLTHEIKSLQAYLNSGRKLPNIAAGINLDMVGVSMDNKINIGDSTPVFPNYAPPFLKSLLKEYGFQVIVSEITAMDTQFSDPEYKAPMSFMDLFGVPDYHKSGDTPDTISPAVLERTWNVAYRYVDFLVNAGFHEAKLLAGKVMEYEAEREKLLRDPETELRTGHASPAFAKRIVHERLDSILPLVEKEKQQDFREYLCPLHAKAEAMFSFADPVKRPVMSPEQRKKLSSLIPVKAFHGTLSFEKYMPDAEKYPRIKKMLRGWSVIPWLDYAVMWADGTRTAAEIWELLAESGNPADPELLFDLMSFLVDKQYINIK